MFKNEEEIKKHFNTTKLVTDLDRKVIQVQHYQTRLFHYLTKKEGVWVDTGMTSVTSEWF